MDFSKTNLISHTKRKVQIYGYTVKEKIFYRILEMNLDI